jgi:hypothetical protein
MSRETEMLPRVRRAVEKEGQTKEAGRRSRSVKLVKRYDKRCWRNDQSSRIRRRRRRPTRRSQRRQTSEAGERRSGGGRKEKTRRRSSSERWAVRSPQESVETGWEKALVGSSSRVRVLGGILKATCLSQSSDQLLRRRCLRI